MGEHFFGLGPGHLSERVRKAAAAAGGELVNHTEPRGEERHWFACENRGEPFDSRTAREVMAAVRKAATKKDKQVDPNLVSAE